MIRTLILNNESEGGDNDNGPVEFVINNGKNDLFIIEVKSSLNPGFAMSYEDYKGLFQLLAQLTAAWENNPDLPYLFGALTGLSEWVFVKFQPLQNNEQNSGFTVKLSQGVELLRAGGGGWESRNLNSFYSFLFEILLDAKKIASSASNDPSPPSAREIIKRVSEVDELKTRQTKEFIEWYRFHYDLSFFLKKQKMDGVSKEELKVKFMQQIEQQIDSIYGTEKK